MSVTCPECGQRCPDMHYLVDHMSDDHDLFSWVTAGRPVAMTDGGELHGE